MPVEELGGPDCDPQRFRLLGEDLVLFRDTKGDVGVFSEVCPHRGLCRADSERPELRRLSEGHFTDDFPLVAL